MHDLEVHTDPVDVQDDLHDAGHLMTDGILPLAGSDLGEAAQTGNGEPFLLGSVHDEVVELGINCCPQVSDVVQPVVSVLLVGHAVVKLTNTFTNERQLSISAQDRGCQN